MAKPLAELLAEARDPQTPSARLSTLSRHRKTSERTALREVLAANPNLEEALLWELALEFPAAVVNNPMLQIIQLRDLAWWTQCGTGPLLSLLSVMGVNAPEQARDFLFQTLVDELMSHGDVSLKGEYTLSFSHDISIDWAPEETGDSDDGDCDNEDDDDEDAENEDDEIEEEPEEASQDFNLNFKCSGDHNYSLTIDSAPSDAAELCWMLETLWPPTGAGLDAETLKSHRWSVDGPEMDDGYWDLDDYEPDLPDWEFSADLQGDGSGTVTVTDPTGFSHEVDIDQPDYDCDQSDPVIEDDLARVLSLQGLDARTIQSRLKAAFLLT